MYPAADAEFLFDDTFRYFGGVSRNHFLLTVCQRFYQIEESRDGRCMAVLLNECVERLHQVPGRRIDLRLETGMNVLLRTTTPPLTAGGEFQLHNTLRAKFDLEAAVGILI